MVSHAKPATERIRSVYGSGIGDDEVMVLKEVQSVFRNSLEHGLPLHKSAQQALNALKELLNQASGENLRANIDVHVLLRDVDLSHSTATSDHSPSDREKRFADDVIHAIDFALRNGISSRFILNVLAHDLHEVLVVGSDHLYQGFLPKSAGWARMNREPVDDPDLPEDIE